MRKAALFGFVLLLLCGQPKATKAASDFQLWSEIGLKYKISKKFRLGLDGHIRFDDKASQLESLMPELSFTYRPFKFLRFKAGYRYLMKPDHLENETVYYSWHRFFLDLRLRYRLKPITFKYRLRYQEQFYIGEIDSKYRHTLRNKLSLEWKAGLGFEPFLAGELFIRFGDKDGVLHKWRATLGCAYEFSSNQFALFYRLEDRLDDPAEPTAHILGLSYHYSF